MRLRSTLFTLAAIGSLLSACHKHDEQPPVDNQANETVAPAPPAPEPLPEALPEQAPKPDKIKPKPAPKPDADQQMTDDADATGMTSHASRDADGSDTSGTPAASAEGNSQL